MMAHYDRWYIAVNSLSGKSVVSLGSLPIDFLKKEKKQKKTNVLLLDDTAPLNLFSFCLHYVALINQMHASVLSGRVAVFGV